ATGPGLPLRRWPDVRARVEELAVDRGGPAALGGAPRRALDRPLTRRVADAGRDGKHADLGRGALPADELGRGLRGRRARLCEDADEGDRSGPGLKVDPGRRDVTRRR